VLLPDEPVSALDTELRSAMHALLADIRASVAPTIPIVTHDLAEASSGDSVGGRAEEVVVLVPQEILHVVGPHTDGAAATGRIESIRWEGARQVAYVRLDADPSRWGGPVNVLAEVAVGRTHRVGDSVAVGVVGPLVTVPAQGGHARVCRVARAGPATRLSRRVSPPRGS
jgi:energy-coupling factor transporter ATP-binding protein EcfA2